MASRSGFPYHIPDPAGSEFNTVTYSFNYDNWHLFLHARELKPYGPNTLDYSVSQVKTKALQRDFTKFRIAVRVMAIRSTYLAMQLVLEDPTGSINATVPNELLLDPTLPIRKGSFLVLKDVLPILNLSYVAAGFRIDFAKCVHFTFNRSIIAGHYLLVTACPSSFKPLTLTVFKKPVATTHKLHAALIRGLRAELHADTETRNEERTHQEKARRGRS